MDSSPRIAPLPNLYATLYELGMTRVIDDLDREVWSGAYSDAARDAVGDALQLLGFVALDVGLDKSMRLYSKPDSTDSAMLLFGSGLHLSWRRKLVGLPYVGCTHTDHEVVDKDSHNRHTCRACGVTWTVEV